MQTFCSGNAQAVFSFQKILGASISARKRKGRNSRGLDWSKTKNPRPVETTRAECGLRALAKQIKRN